MDGKTVEALAKAQGLKLSSAEAVETIAAGLKPALPRVAAAAARTPFEAEPAEIMKVLRP